MNKRIKKKHNKTQIEQLLDDYGLYDINDVRFVLDQYQKVICNCTKLLSKITYDADVVISQICDTQTDREHQELIDDIVSKITIDIQNKDITKDSIILLQILCHEHIYPTDLPVVCKCVQRRFPNNLVIAIPDETSLQICDKANTIQQLETLLNKLKN